MGFFRSFSRAFPHSCVANAEWHGDYLCCKKCGDIIGARVPVVYRSSIYMFTPMTQEACENTKEICEKFDLLDSDAFLHKLNSDEFV